MTKTTPVVLAAAAAFTMSASAASACDLHGPGNFGGFHRYNPFASAMQNAPAPDLPKAAKPQEASAKTAKAAKPEVDEKEAKRRAKALERSLTEAEDQAKADQSKIR